jgi:hypothetical protein
LSYFAELKLQRVLLLCSKVQNKNFLNSKRCSLAMSVGAGGTIFSKRLEHCAAALGYPMFTLLTKSYAALQQRNNRDLPIKTRFRAPHYL